MIYLNSFTYDVTCLSVNLFSVVTNLTSQIFRLAGAFFPFQRVKLRTDQTATFFSSTAVGNRWWRSKYSLKRFILIQQILQLFLNLRIFFCLGRYVIAKGTPRPGYRLLIFGQIQFFRFVNQSSLSSISSPKTTTLYSVDLYQSPLQTYKY